MIKVAVRGLGEEVVVGGELAEFLFAVWSDPTRHHELPKTVSTGSVIFQTKDIKNITKSEPRKASEPEKPNAAEQEYLDFRRKMQTLSPDKRARILRFPKLIYRAHTGQELPEELKPQIIARQYAYFKDHPNCIYANPKVYAELIPTTPRRESDDSVQPKELMAVAMLRVVAEAIQTDLVYASKETSTEAA